jgi:hypothetical protein
MKVDYRVLIALFIAGLMFGGATLNFVIMSLVVSPFMLLPAILFGLISFNIITSFIKHLRETTKLRKSIKNGDFELRQTSAKIKIDKQKLEKIFSDTQREISQLEEVKQNNLQYKKAKSQVNKIALSFISILFLSISLTAGFFIGIVLSIVSFFPVLIMFSPLLSRVNKKYKNINFDYSGHIKNNIFTKSIHYFDNAKYSPSNHIYYNNLSEHHFFEKNYDKLYGEDYISIEHNGINIEASELNVVQETRDRSYSPLSGFIIIYKLDTPICSEEVIGMSKNFRFLHMLPPQVNLEDSVFANMFNLHSNDQVRARMLMTPDFMNVMTELFNYLSDKYKTYGFEFSFKGNQLAIHINTMENLFEPKIDKKLREDFKIDIIEDFIKQVSVITSIADVLKLDKKV